MNNTIMLHGGLITTKEASTLFKYTSSYLSHLIRTKKINGQRLGRSWLIEQDSLVCFVEHQWKQDAKNVHMQVRPHSQEQQTLRPPDTVVKFSSIEQNPISRLHHRVPDGSYPFPMSPKWITAVSTVILLFFSATIAQAPIFSQSIHRSQTFPGSMSSMPLALEKFVMVATYAVTIADTTLAYSITTAAPVTARVAAQILIGIGDTLSNTTARIPMQVASVFAHGTR